MQSGCRVLKDSMLKFVKEAKTKMFKLKQSDQTAQVAETSVVAP